MNSNITIQKAVPEDSQGIGEVFYETWLATYPNAEVGITTDDVEDIWKNRSIADGSRFKSFPDNELFLTAKCDGLVVGVCSLVKHEDKNELKAIYVLPEYQGKGIGKMFWNEALKYFDKNKKITVDVADYNTPAINFYKKLGFIDSGNRFPMKIKFKSGAVITEMEMIIPATNTVV